MHYDPMDIASLMERLMAAERALVVFGWCAIGSSERDDAAGELWSRWSKLVPDEFLHRTAHPEIDVGELAEARRATRRATLARMGLADLET